MPDIVLTTLNARYAHAAFGLRYLLANLGPLRERASLIDSDSPRYRRVIRAWQALPVPVTRVIGPIIRKRLSN